MIRVTDDTSTESLTRQLQKALADHLALPYLFMGSGISRRYLNLPDWVGLLRIFAEDAGEDLDYHLASAGGDLPTAASTVADKFHDRWWSAPEYAEQRNAHKAEVKDRTGGLKVAIASYVQDRQQLRAGHPGVDDQELAHEIATLSRAVVDGVITTNYDSLTDQLFPGFPPYVGQDELLLSDAQFIAETYKIHGSAEHPMSLVVTREDYFAFRKRNHYLAAKLLTIFAEQPVIFVGYSLTDKYIGEILDNIATAVGPDRIDELGERIYFVEWNEDAGFEPVIEQSSLVREDVRLPITRIETHSLAWIWEALAGLERPFPAGVLRELRKHVFDLVTHPDPSQTREVVRAIPIDGDQGSEYRVVFGVGSFTEKDLQNLSTIGRTLTRDDVVQDVLGLRKRPLDPENVLLSGIPDAIRPGPTQYIPVHKYLGECGRISADGAIDFSALPPVIQSLAERSLTVAHQSRARFDREVRGVYATPAQLLEADLAMYFKLDSLVLLDPDDFASEDLRAALAELYQTENAIEKSNIALFRRAVCLYGRRRALEAASTAI